MPTAITPGGSLDETSQRRVVQYCLNCGAVAIGHFGIASEYQKISSGDRTRLIKLIVGEVAGRVPVFIGVTSPAGGTSLEHAREAEQLGAEMIMASLPEAGAADEREAASFYESLSRATSLPLIVQDTPESSSILTAELIWRMSHEIERIDHVKAEGKDFLEKTSQLMRLSGGTLSVIGGAGGRRLIHLLRLGVTAFMTGTEALDLHAASVSAYLDGDEERAAEIYFRRILPYLDFYLDYPEELLKTMLHARGVIDFPDIIPPRRNPAMSDAERREFDWILDRIGWRKRWPEIP